MFIKVSLMLLRRDQWLRGEISAGCVIKNWLRTTIDRRGGGRAPVWIFTQQAIPAGK